MRVRDGVGSDKEKITNPYNTTIIMTSGISIAKWVMVCETRERLPNWKNQLMLWERGDIWIETEHLNFGF